MYYFQKRDRGTPRETAYDRKNRMKKIETEIERSRLTLRKRDTIRQKETD